MLTQFIHGGGIELPYSVFESSFFECVSILT
jgi:hypothetical protein